MWDFHVTNWTKSVIIQDCSSVWHETRNLCYSWRLARHKQLACRGSVLSTEQKPLKRPPNLPADNDWIWSKLNIVIKERYRCVCLGELCLAWFVWITASDLLLIAGYHYCI